MTVSVTNITAVKYRTTCRKNILVTFQIGNEWILSLSQLGSFFSVAKNVVKQFPRTE